MQPDDLVVRLMAIPALSDTAVKRVGSLLVHADQLVDEVFYSGGQPTQRMAKLIRLVRDDLSDHEMMALKLALDREGWLPKEER